MRNIVIIGDGDTGKTTLANALLGWDIFPQSHEYVPAPTTHVQSHALGEQMLLTDTPGYSLLWETVPEDTIRAVSGADTLIVLLSEELAEEDFDLPGEDPDWESRREKEEKLLKGILEHSNTRDIFFVIPYDTGDWPQGQVPLTQALRLARNRFSPLTCHAEQAFFCIDPRKALLGAIEADDAAVAESGIGLLQAALFSRQEEYNDSYIG